MEPCKIHSLEALAQEQASATLLSTFSTAPFIGKVAVNASACTAATALIPYTTLVLTAPRSRRHKWISSFSKSTITHISHLLRECCNCQPVLLGVGITAEQNQVHPIVSEDSDLQGSINHILRTFAGCNPLGSREEIITFLVSDLIHLLRSSGKASTAFESLIDLCTNQLSLSKTAVALGTSVALKEKDYNWW